MDKIGHELVNHFFFMSTVPISKILQVHGRPFHQVNESGLIDLNCRKTHTTSTFEPTKHPSQKTFFEVFCFFSQCQGNPKPSFFWGYDPYIEGLKPSFFMVLGSKGVGYLSSLQPFAIPPHSIKSFGSSHFAMVCFDRINATVTSVPNNFYRTMLRTSRTWVFIGERLTHQQLR